MKTNAAQNGMVQNWIALIYALIVCVCVCVNEERVVLSFNRENAWSV